MVLVLKAEHLLTGVLCDTSVSLRLYIERHCL